MCKFILSILIHLTLTQINAQPEQTLYSFDFSDNRNGWSLANIQQGGFDSNINTADCPTGSGPCWQIGGGSSVTRSVSTSNFHDIRMTIDAHEVGLETNEWCYLAYNTALTFPGESVANIITRNDGVELNAEVNVHYYYANSDTFEVTLGVSAISGKYCYYDNLKIFGIPYTDDPTPEPSNNPTATPSDFPSIPSKSPSNIPSKTPSNNPLLSPSNYPTFDTTENNTPIMTTSHAYASTTISHEQQLEKQLSDLATLYRNVCMTFMSTFVMITTMAFIDAKFIRINDYCNYLAVMSMSIQTIDMMSDCFFVIEVNLQYNFQSNIKHGLILLAAITFIIFPAFISLFQLYFYAKQHWLTNEYVRYWISSYSTILLLLSIITGNSFASVSLLNSNIFQFDVFDMGLTKRQLQAYNTKRVYSVVLLENVPQLILQSYYVSIQGGVKNPIVISSIIFSIISIIISILSMALQKYIHKTQNYVILKMDILFANSTEESTKCRTMNKQLTNNMTKMIGIDENVLEIVKPICITQGLKLHIIVYGGEEAIDYDMILSNNKENGKLAQLLQESWGLISCPTVSNVYHETVESKRNRSEYIKQQTVATNSIQMT